MQILNDIEARLDNEIEKVTKQEKKIPIRWLVL